MLAPSTFLASAAVSSSISSMILPDRCLIEDYTILQEALEIWYASNLLRRSPIGTEGNQTEGLGHTSDCWCIFITSPRSSPKVQSTFACSSEEGEWCLAKCSLHLFFGFAHGRHSHHHCSWSSSGYSPLLGTHLPALWTGCRCQWNTWPVLSEK